MPETVSSSTQMSDATEELPTLLARAAQRDEAAARLLVERLGPLVHRIIRSHASLRHEVDDLTQDIFFKIFRAAPAYRAEAPMEHWVSRIAKFTCINRLQRSPARHELAWSHLSADQQAFLASNEANAEPAGTGEDSLALIERLLATLAPIDAWLLRAVELEERPLAEVSAEAGWNATLTRVRLFRARRRLKQALITLESQHHEQA